MTERPTENDLLDLIEGRLPAERVEIVRAALMGDRELLARVEGMVRDRRVLQESAASDPRAPRGMTQESIARAERDALFGTGRPSRRTLRGRPVLVGLAMAAGVALVAGGVALTLSSMSRPGKIIHTVYGNSGAAPQKIEPEPVPESAVASAPWTPPEPIAVVPKPDEQIDAWTRQLAEAPADPSPADSAEISPAWLTDETVRLAMEGRLKLEVPAGVLVAQEDSRDTPLCAIDRPRLLAVRFKTDEGADGLRRALGRLPSRIPGVMSALIRATERPTGTDESAAVEPISLDPEDVLWWTRPASEWARYSRVYVTVAPAQASPERK